MTVLHNAQSRGVAADIVAQLGEIERSRNFTLSIDAHEGSEADAAVARAFVRELRDEMHAFHAIAHGALAAADTNARQLHDLVESTEAQSAMVQRAASAVSELGAGAAQVAMTAAALRATTDVVADETRRYDAGIDEVLRGLSDVRERIASAHTFAARIDVDAANVAVFLGRLHGIARQARLLGINAAIEAAHLGGAGAGFGIVATEIRALAASTHASAADVAAIERELHAASRDAATSIDESGLIVDTLAAEIAAARQRSSERREQIAALGEAIVRVASAATEQNVKLAAIAEAVERSSAFAATIQGAAQRAALLDIRGARDRLASLIEEYTLGAGDARATDVAAPRAEVAFADDAIAAAAAALRARIDDDQRDILRSINAVSVAIARTTFEWRAIALSVGGLRTQFQATAASIEATLDSAHDAADGSRSMRSLLELARGGFASAVDALEHSLAAVTHVHATVESAEAFVRNTSAAGTRAGSILALIDAVSAETTLLSLNAAIEAAHAGDAGAGFGVIADEIRTLARMTLEATHEIGIVLDGVAEASGAMSATTGAVARETAVVAERTDRVRDAVVALRARLERTLHEAADVATIVEQQFVAIGDVRSASEQALARLDSDFAAVTDVRRLDLANLGMQAHALAARRTLGITADAIRTIGFAVAEQIDSALDRAIAAGTITLEDCFDTDYREITGPRIADLARLFDVSRVPVTGFDPPKFATRYDRLVEDGVNRIIDESVLAHPAITAMFAVDLNGYCFAHVRECRQAWTGDSVTDLNTNRIKRFFEDALSLRCSRNGLGPSGVDLPPRTARATFAARGCTLVRGPQRPWAIYTYARDTGIVYNDLSVGIFARDQRIGTIRILYDADVV